MSKLTPRRIIGTIFVVVLLIVFIVIGINKILVLLGIIGIILGWAALLYLIIAATGNRWDWWND